MPKQSRHYSLSYFVEKLEDRRLLSGEPRILQSQFLFETAHEVRFTVDQDVSASLAAADLVLKNLFTGTMVPVASTSVAWDSATKTAKFTFPGFAGGVLPDGNYFASLAAAGIANTNGQSLLGDHDFEFFFHNGDFNRDRDINSDDFNILAGHWGQTGRTYSDGDATYNGTVDSDDFNVMAGKFGATLYAPPAPGAITVTAVSSTSVTLNWALGAVLGELGWRVQWSTDGQNFEFLKNVGPGVTSTPVSGLQPGTRFWFRVRAYGNGQDTAYSPKKAATTVMPEPGQLSIVSRSGSSVTLAWPDNSENEDGFKVKTYLDGQLLRTDTAAASSGATATYTVQGLEELTSYEFEVIAFRSVSGAESAPTPRLAAVTRLSTPASFSVTAIHPTLVVANWTDTSQHENVFQVQRKAVSDSQWQEGWKVVTVNSTTVTGDTVAGVAYDYRIRAQVAPNVEELASEWSNVIRFTTQVTGPGTPTGLTVSRRMNTGLQISWTDVPYEDGYKIYQWGFIGGNWQWILVNNQVARDQTTATVFNLMPETDYRIRVSAKNSVGESQMSAEAASTTLASGPPTDLRYMRVTKSSVLLTWDDAQSFRQSVRIIASSGQFQDLGSPYPTSYNFQNLEQTNTAYTFKMRNNAAIGAGFSNEVTVTTASEVPDSPVHLTGNAIANGIDLSWRHDRGQAHHYEVERALDAPVGFQKIGEPGGRTHRDMFDGLTTGTNIYYRVRGVSSGGQLGAYSKQYIYQVGQSELIDSLSSAATSSSQARLSWTPSNAGSIQIQRSQSATVGFASIGSVSASAGTFAVSALQPSTTYYFRAAQESGPEASSYSGITQVTTPPLENPPPPAGGYVYFIYGLDGKIGETVTLGSTYHLTIANPVVAATSPQDAIWKGVGGKVVVHGPTGDRDNFFPGPTFDVVPQSTIIFEDDFDNDFNDHYFRVNLVGGQLEVLTAETFEGTASDDAAEIRLTLNQPAVTAVTIPFYVVTGESSASAADYTIEGAFAFAAGEFTKTIKVRANADGQEEDDEVVMLALGQAGANPPAAAKVPVVLKDVTVKATEVTYLERDPDSFFPIRKDDAREYEGPHWKDNSSPLNGNADDPGDNKRPLAYLRDKLMKLEAKFTLSPGFAPQGRVRIRGSNTIYPAYSFYGDTDANPNYSVTINGSTVTLTDECSRKFENFIDHFDTFDIKWEMSFDDGNSWTHAGTTKNQVYVLLNEPKAPTHAAAISEHFHTTLHLSTKAAKGETDPVLVVGKIWDEFKDNDVRQVGSSVPMKYSHPAEIQRGETTQDLLGLGWGRCGGWARFFADTIRAQGIDANTSHIAPSVAPLPPDPGFTYDRTTIKVNPSPAQGTGGANYGQVEFNDHAVTKVPAVPNTIYDPSYGGQPHTGASITVAEAQWEDSALAGIIFTYKNAAGDETIKFFANRVGVPDVDFTP